MTTSIQVSIELLNVLKHEVSAMQRTATINQPTLILGVADMLKELIDLSEQPAAFRQRVIQALRETP